jgi:hypothetical protein
VELFSCLAEAQVLIEDWRQDYNHHRPHSSLQMMTPAAFAASLRQPPGQPTATTAGEEVEGRGRLTNTIQRSTHRIIPAGPQQNPAEDITPAPWQADSHSRYGATTITPTQLSEQVDQ